MSSPDVPKESSPEMSSLAGRVMAGYEPTRAEVLSLAACVLGQDETKGTQQHVVRIAEAPDWAAVCGRCGKNLTTLDEIKAHKCETTEPGCETTVTFTEAEPRDNWTAEDEAESNKLRDQLKPLPSFLDPLGR